MKLGEMYDTAIRMGIEADPRGREVVERSLATARRRFEALPEYLKSVFDPEELTNPYVDTRVYVGDRDAEVTALIAGIDMNVGEVLLADRLREKGRRIDAIYTHHPEGMALSKLDRVMEMQAEVWESWGVPINVGESVMDERRVEVRRRFMPMNVDQATDAARLLDIPFFSAHTPTDNLVYDLPHPVPRRARAAARRRRPARPVRRPRVSPRGGQGRRAVRDRGEGRQARRQALGRHDRRHRGPGGHHGEARRSRRGHDRRHAHEPDLRKDAEENHIHVVIAGHISSDSVGVNLLMDEFERRGVEIVPTSGLIRVRRDAEWKPIDE